MDLLTRRLGRVAAIAIVALAGTAPAAHAQLLSPGKLIAAHSDLEGVRNCTKCHQLGERGVARDKCLDCHEILAKRIVARSGFHATIGQKTCGECHKDHFGADFDAVHLDTTAFDHTETGYTLAGKHASTDCRACHTPDYITDAAVRREMGTHDRLGSTFLGLGTACVGCHRKDDPHENQFGNRGCEECHAELDWKKPDRFDHARTKYPLRARHREIQCRECHAPIPGRRGALQLTGLAFGACVDCHAKDDPHAGQFPGKGCDACHTEGGWKAAERFDHATTRYPLTGRHARVECEKCHTPVPGRPNTLKLKGIDFAGCASCHRTDDPHEGRLGSTCKDCHTTDGWQSVGGAAFEKRFDHTKTQFPLRGGHTKVECATCHAPRRARATKGIALTFVASTRSRSYPVPVADRCASCHEDQHGGAFAKSPGGIECKSCHTDDGWTPTSYDIARHNRDAAYKLTGAHLAAPCVACHKNPELGQRTLQFRIPQQDCLACHRTLDPHGGQFGDRTCDECHVTDSFKIPAFDHSRTRYPLDGAHRTVPCASCHPTTPGPDGRQMRVYRPLGTACRDCHEGGGA